MSEEMKEKMEVYKATMRELIEQLQRQNELLKEQQRLLKRMVYLQEKRR